MIPPGALAIGGPVAALQGSESVDLAVSIFLPSNELTAVTEHSLGLQTTYVSPEGDFTGADSLPTASTTQYLLLSDGP